MDELATPLSRRRMLQLMAGGLVLITGGLGFIGGYVALALLDQGRRVAVLTRGRSTSVEMRYVLREHEGGEHCLC